MQLNIAVVGAGLIGRAHIDRIRRSPECRLAAIADPSEGAAVQAREFGVAHFTSLSALLGAAPPDGVLVATPSVEHVESAMLCIERGIPVLIEKPIADTIERARRIVDAAQRTGIAVLVGHHRRHNPVLARARDLIRDGELGRIATVVALVAFLKPDDYFNVAWRREAGGGPVLINLIHAIDDLRFMCGEIVGVQAFASNALRGFPVEDSAVVNLRFATGALGAITLSDAAAAPWSWELTTGENPAFPRTGEDCYFIAGTEGSLALPSTRLWRYKAERGWTEPLARERIEVAPADPLSRQLAHFCAVIRGEAAPLIDAEDATRTLAATLAILEAARGNAAVDLAY